MGLLIAFLGGAATAGVVAAVILLWGWRRRTQGARQAEERARRAEQLAYAGGLAGRLIHEIRNPLNTLSLNLQLLEEDWQNPESQKERRALKRIQLLQAETQRLSAVLDDFLGFVRGHRLLLADCDVNKLVDDVLTFMRPELESRKIEIRHSYGQLPVCRLDANLVKQTLLNVILNAEQALAESDNREIIVRTAPEHEDVRIDVIDTGKGIPPGEVGKVFEAFYSTKKGGTGLGLPTSRRIVEEHGGALTVHSEPGRGSCFTITFPARRGEGPPPGTREARGGAA